MPSGFENSPPAYFLGCQTCPNCRETVFAAEGADVSAETVHYRWTCDLCGHAFSTEAKLVAEIAA
jgi:ribosomal protein S27AE